MTSHLNLSEITRNSLLLGLTSYITGAVTPVTAIVIGGTYSLVSQITKPFFEEGGLLSFVFNAAAATGIVNHFAGYSFSVGKVVHITLLPTLLVLKIIAISLVLMSLFSMSAYLIKSF